MRCLVHRLVYLRPAGWCVETAAFAVVELLPAGWRPLGRGSRWEGSRCWQGRRWQGRRCCRWAYRRWQLRLDQMQWQSIGRAALACLHRQTSRRRTSATGARFERRVPGRHPGIPAARADLVLRSHSRFPRDRWSLAVRVAAKRTRARFADVAPAPRGARELAALAQQLALRHLCGRWCWLSALALCRRWCWRLETDTTRTQ